MTKVNTEARGPANSVQASKARKGKDSVKANRVPVIEKGHGLTIVGILHSEQSTMMDYIKGLKGLNKESFVQTIAELDECRDDEVKAVKGSENDKARKVNVIRATFSRIRRCIVALKDGHNVDRMMKAETWSEFTSLATKPGAKNSGTKGKKVQLRASGFATWSAKVDRVCLKADDAEGLARLEKHLIQTLAALAKFEHQTTVPVRDMLALTATPKKRHLKAA